MIATILCVLAGVFLFVAMFYGWRFVTQPNTRVDNDNIVIGFCFLCIAVCLTIVGLAMFLT